MSLNLLFTPNGEEYIGVIHLHRLKNCLDFVQNVNGDENDPYSIELKELVNKHLLFLEILDMQLESKVWRHNFATYGRLVSVVGILVLHDQYARRFFGFASLANDKTWLLAEKFVAENSEFFQNLTENLQIALN